MNTINIKLWWAIGIVLLLNLFALTTPFTALNWDSETHLFFADHYRQDWFDPWEERWFEGFFVFSYPPLSHQLIALFSFAFEAEVSYKIVQGLALVALPVSMWLFVRENFGRQSAGYAAILSVLVPSIYLILYTFGQLPSFLSMVLALAGLGCFGRYIRLGSYSALIGWAGLLGAAAATHHHTVLIIVPGLVGILLVQQWIRPQMKRARLLRLQFFALVAGGYTSMVVLMPFLWWSQNFYQSQVEIPHPTRGEIFSSDLYAELFFWGIYGSLLIAAPLAMVLLLKQKQWIYIPLMLGVITLAVLGLGTLTPIPKILFGVGNVWEWLTYERFAVWASVLSVVPIALWISSSPNRQFVVSAMTPIVLVLIVVAARETTLPQNEDLVPSPLETWEEAEIIKFLEDDNHSQWNYITLGLGEAELARISRQTNATTIDGTYYTVRQREELRESGIPSIDSSIYQEESPEILLSILARPEEWNLKWAIMGKPEFEQLLDEAGWVKIHPLGSDFTYQPKEVYYSTVWIWQVPDTHFVPMRSEQTPPDYPALAPIIWGILPLGYLVIGALAAAWSVLRMKEETVG